jgi:hypothetical protein
MRNLNSLVAFLPLLLASPGAAQHPTVNANADAGLPHDIRPFGKYLVEICTLSGENRTLACTRTPLAPEKADSKDGKKPPADHATPQQIDQTITLKLACDPTAKGPCKPQYPLVAGHDFFVSATADSGLAVQQKGLSGSATRVISSSATPAGADGTVSYHANEPGLIIIRATVGETSVFKAAAPVDLLLQVVAGTAKAAPPCAVLPPAPPAPAQSTPLDAPTIVSLLGNPTPFLFAAQGPNTIAIYSTRQPLHDDENTILNSFQDSIAALAGRTAASLGIAPPPAKPFSVELSIPHATALGDLATRINGLNYSQFTVQNVGSDKVRVTAAAAPECDTWTGFLSDIRHMGWQLVSEPMSTRLFYLSSSDVATAFTGLAPAAAAAATPAATAPAASATPATPAAATPAASATAAATSSNASIVVTQPPGSNIQIRSDTTPCVVAGLASGNTGACGSAATPAATPATPAAPTTPAAIPAPKATLGMASVAVAMGTGEQTPPDLLVFSDTNPGDDAQVQERLRIIAQLDLPRPEMIVNAWVMQNSSASQRAMGAFSNMVKGIVADYDSQFEWVVLRGWHSLKTQSASPGYFNEPFRGYLADRFVADTYQKNKAASTVQDLSQAFLDNSQAKLADPIAPTTRTRLGICERGRYCLGYNNLFSPLKPALTDLLLTIVAAQHPVDAATNAIAEVEGHSPALPAPLAPNVAACNVPNPAVRSRCRAIWNTLDLDHVSPPPGNPTCADLDYRGILDSLLNSAGHEPRVHLRCFAEEVRKLLSANAPPPYGAGLIRAAIADFLFNYKMSQHYPHEFSPYDLKTSADALNTALSPIIDAFNRDLTSYQLFVRADMQYRVDLLNARNDDRCCVKRLFGVDKPSFFNDGLITVRTISGQWTYVNTTSQSFLNASTAPELSTLLNSLSGTNPNSSGAGSLASTALSASPLKRSELLAGALANYQTTFAQIGRTLQISAIPRSLSTASSAEIAVTLNADESAGGPAYTGGGASDPALNTSRVANHDTATRVRVDSVKLFEISSFSAIVERSRSRFPLLPPFVEIPYIGTFAGIPLGAAKEFHSSTAVLSAYVVPTASDIAYGLRFVSDLVVDGLNSGPCSFYKGAAGPDVTHACLFRKALSLHDLNNQPVSNFNKEMVRCLATDTSAAGCQRVSFDGVPNY